jgi:hypothetical protein
VKMIGNELFAFYGLTRFLLLYLLREVLETDVEGKKFCLKPSTFIKQPRGKSRVLECTDTIAQVVVRLLDAEIKRRDCTPQKHHPVSRSNFFQPVFMVQPAEDILDSDPASGWQLMPLNSRPTYWFSLEIWNAWPQA